MTSLAEETRQAVEARPFLRTALAAGVVNYAAAADFLAVEADERKAVAAALRRYASELGYEEAPADARVTMRSGLEPAADGGELLSVNGRGFAAGDGDLTCVLAVGDVGTRALGAVLDRLHAAGVSVDAAGAAGDALLVVVGRRDGATAVREVEAALDAVPSVGGD